MDSQTLHLAFSGLTSVAGFFIAMWIKGVRDDVKETVSAIGAHAQRITKLETQVEFLITTVEGLGKRG